MCESGLEAGCIPYTTNATRRKKGWVFKKSFYNYFDFTELENELFTFLKNLHIALSERIMHNVHRRSQYEANRGTHLGKILPNTVDFYFFYQTDNIRRFHTASYQKF